MYGYLVVRLETLVIQHTGCLRGSCRRVAWALAWLTDWVAWPPGGISGGYQTTWC